MLRFGLCTLCAGLSVAGCGGAGEAEVLGDCPPDLACQVIPAAYASIDGTATRYGNYDPASRPGAGLDVRYIVIHTTETRYDDTIRVFQDPRTQAAAHYLIRSADGQVVRMIDPKDVAWHAGNWFFNMHSVGIEHEGMSADGAAWYTEAQIRASAKLVRHLAARFGIPLDRAHILGHDEIPGASPERQGGMHWDPGPFWDWERYMALLGAPLTAATKPAQDLVMIRPGFAGNSLSLTDCPHGPSGDCRQLGPQPADVVSLREAPDPGAAAVGDSYLPPATNDVRDWGSTARSGQVYVQAERRGDWRAIYFGGRLAWFQDPAGTAAVPARSQVVAPRAGRSTIAVFGFAAPEDLSYRAPATPQRFDKLYDMPAGQRYAATGPFTADYYWAKTFASTWPAPDHFLVRGATAYFQIAFNHRMAFVAASDVDATTP